MFSPPLNSRALRSLSAPAGTEAMPRIDAVVQTSTRSARAFGVSRTHARGPGPPVHPGRPGSAHFQPAHRVGSHTHPGADVNRPPHRLQPRRTHGIEHLANEAERRRPDHPSLPLGTAPDLPSLVLGSVADLLDALLGIAGRIGQKLRHPGLTL